MAQSTTLRLRALWLQVHKWIGLCLAILIIPISLTGAALVWDEPLDRLINPQRYAVTVPGPPFSHVMTPGEVPPSVHERSARQALGPDARIVSIRYPEGTGPVVVTAIDANARAQSGPPPRVNVWLDPGRLLRSPDRTIRVPVLDAAPANKGLVRIFHNLHGSLMIPGGWGRTIVGWVGIFMFCSCLTGIWLWWPLTGSLSRGFRWRRQNSTNANLHHLFGFWILLPLGMLSFTGFWISFPGAFSAFEASQPKGKSGGGPPGRARPLAETRLGADAALAAAAPHATGALVSLAWPTDQSGEWKINYARDGGSAEVAVDDASGEVTPPRPPRPETRARLMRRLHDGTGMGFVWQALIFLGGIVPAILAVTGIVMWLRSRGWRAALARKRKAAKLAPQPAE